MEKTSKSDSPLVGFSTGFRDLDNITLGLQEGDLILVAGRPSMGKTAFALSIAGQLVNDGIPSVLFSLEMSARSIMYRLISLLGKIELKKLFEAKNLSDSDFNEIGLKKIENFRPIFGKIMKKIKNRYKIVFLLSK